MLCFFGQDDDYPVSSPGPVQNEDNNKSNTMAPVINVLNQWGAEAPFEEEGVNVLAVNQKCEL